MKDFKACSMPKAVLWWWNCPNNDETTVHACHCAGNVALCMGNSLKPDSRMLPKYLRHSRPYCLEYCSGIWEHMPSATTTIAGLYHCQACKVDLSSTLQACWRFFQNAGEKKKFYVNGAGDRWRCTSGKYSPQFITSKMAAVLAF